jgi:long-chain fatty acid transport protein
MATNRLQRAVLLTSGMTIAAALGAGAASAGGFGVREQSAYFLGSSFAGSAAGGDISSMFWNSAATAAQSGCNFSGNFTTAFGQIKETGEGGTLVTGVPAPPLVVPPLSPTSTELGTTVLIPATYGTCQLTSQLYVGLGLNAPFGLRTKPDDTTWAGSPFATSSYIFTTDINPTVAYKLTPELTIGVGLQVEFFSVRLDRGALGSSLGPLSGGRAFDADDWGVGATAGILWQPSRATSIGIGYRSAVNVSPSGDYTRGATSLPFPAGSPAVMTTASAGLTLPDEVTLSARQYVTPRLALLGTVEWQNWSRLQNVTATSAGCGGVCEVLNLSYRDGWFYAIGAEYAYTPWLTLRAGIAYEQSPIEDSTRDIIVPDSNRVELSTGATYKYSEKISFDIAYSHLFFEDGTFCIANATSNPGGTSHCNNATPATAVLLTGKTDVSADLLAVGLKYKF